MTREPLLSDTRGAMMVLGLVMALLLVGALYYVIGIGQAIDQREALQDAADAGAFSAAVLHARGMNLIALLNVVMAALLAVLVALKLVEAVLAIAIVLLAAAAFFTGGAAAGAIPEVESLRRTARQSHDRLRGPIHGALETLHATARGVRVVVPWMAQVNAFEAARRQGTMLNGGIALPSRTTLATSDGRFSSLCDQAGGYVGDTAKILIPPLPGGVDDDVGEALGDLARARADWFCGDDRAQPPKTTVTERRTLPTLPARRRCESNATTGDYVAGDCEAAAREEARSAPNPATGACESEACIDRAQRAREVCRPGMGNGLFNWSYVVRRVHKKWGHRRGKWRLVATEAREAPTLVMPDPERRDATPPCGRADARIAANWNPTRGDAASAVEPVCAETPAFPTIRSGAATGWHEQDITEIADVYGCMRVARREIDVGDHVENDGFDRHDRERKVPQAVASRVLGGEPWQVRGLVFAKAPSATSERVIEVAGAGHGRGRRPLDDLRALGRVAFAQAEYHYAVPDPDAPDPERWLWNMRWRARLRRFHLPTRPSSVDTTDDAGRWNVGTPVIDLAAACRRIASDARVCGVLSNGALDRLVLH